MVFVTQNNWVLLFDHRQVILSIKQLVFAVEMHNFCI
jgi:hypothetical protein